MEPVVFDGCLGWLHPASGRHGVVLCNPFGYDALCTHRGWRRLAERIAASGMPVLRFDYPGAGDSLGEEEDPGRFEAWIDSIVAAVRHLRERTGVRQVSLCGLRLGATLAALAGERMGDIDGLVMLAPALSGRNYLRELRAHRQSWLSTPAGMTADPIPETAAYVEAFGFGLHGDDIARLGAVDLRADTRAPARRVLLLDASDRARGGVLVDHYEANGVAVERQPFDEADRFMVEALYSEEPVVAFGALTQWLADAPPCLAHDGEFKGERHDGDNPHLTSERFVEQPVVFGDYFGVHCQPAAPRTDVPAVLFLNTGASHHIGDGRIFVLFARRLAALGIASLRMDLGGLGDSTPAARSVTLDTIYSKESYTDAMQGADWLVAHGYPSVVVFGVCGGAFVGLHACAQHPRIVGSFGVNLQKFIWDGADRTPGTTGLASNRVLRRSALSVGKWKKVLRGETSLLRVASGLAQRFARSLTRRAADFVDAATGWSFAPSEARSLMQRIHAKGAEVRLVYGEYDLGLDELKVQFGAKVSGLRAFTRVHAATLPKLDHALFTQAAREAAMADARQWYFERFCRRRAQDEAAWHGPVPVARSRVAVEPASQVTCSSHLDGVHQ
ncbi:Serine aminopeptidase, S33 [Paraburkholderia unamae]|uniref:serine aminopeptidase domain-containing protein n=1 Tax=Paraburkholderia unamae TaxID=219649 RepID=UPI000DC45776|nr:alpha/beta hydrolase [Paraburkholderia unamae]RAR60596.1 serine aminopeptidase S33 family [Paraburkholderia unamae]CAG9250573.1 Serine aminopeptidase, S33 [Paraburkholderia unamae]